MYEIKNITSVDRKFKDPKIGKWITLGPDECYLSRSKFQLGPEFSVGGEVSKPEQQEVVEETQSMPEEETETNKNDEDVESSEETQ